MFLSFLRDIYHSQSNDPQIIILDRKKSFEDAKQFCKDVGGEIAAPVLDTEITEWLKVGKCNIKMIIHILIFYLLFYDELFFFFNF